MESGLPKIRKTFLLQNAAPSIIIFCPFMLATRQLVPNVRDNRNSAVPLKTKNEKWTFGHQQQKSQRVGYDALLMGGRDSLGVTHSSGVLSLALPFFVLFTLALRTRYYTHLQNTHTNTGIFFLVL